MDHHEKHRQAKEHEREEKKREHAAYEQRQQRKGVHPGWLVAAGLLVTLVAVLLWTFVEW
jgi:hypothetical protein